MVDDPSLGKEIEKHRDNTYLSSFVFQFSTPWYTGVVNRRKYVLMDEENDEAEVQEKEVL